LLLVGLWWSQTAVLAAALPYQPIRQVDRVEPASPDTFAWIGAVYQSSRSGNWELYYVPFARPEVQLTNHLAADTLPRLNRGSTHVAFVSARDGNAEIYTIKVDGTSLTRLTTNSVEDTLPYWSPDGRQLIFSSQRTGNGDLYLMNADGSGLRQLTSDPAEDTYPTWSPDGAQLLWVRLYPVVKQQPQEGELWVADANGANARALTGRLRLPARPLISPNGALIALDADLDQNGRPDLVLMDRTTGNAYTFAPSDVGLLRWMGTWSHDSTTLWVTKLTYQVLENGQWILMSTEIEQLCLDNRPGCSSLISGDQRAMMPDRQLADLLAPVSQVDPLPPYSRLNGFLLSWSGKEYGPSGLVAFDIQYRLEGEADWQYFVRGTFAPDILPETPNPETDAREFKPAEAGQYYFRSRTRDYALNYEPWPASEKGDTSTRVFSWYLAGQVTDGRGVPYAQQELALAPAALEPVATDLQGNFQVHIGAPGEYTLADEFTLTMDRDRRQTYYRTPADNLIQNGSFEQPFASGNWQISGTVAITQGAALVHSGRHAVQLGRPCPAPCLATISDGGISADLSQQVLVVDPTGVLHLFARKGQQTLIHQIRTQDGRWLPYVALSNHIFGNWTAGTVFADNGDLHLVWSAPASSDAENETLYYARYRQGQGWTQPETVGAGSVSQLVIDEQQQLHLLYRGVNFDESQLLRLGYRKRASSGAWSAAKVLSTKDNLGSSALAAMGNTIYVSWVEINHRQSVERLFVAVLQADGTLRNRQQVAAGQAAGGYSRYASLSLLADRQQQLHLAWSASNAASLYYTNQRNGGPWEPIELYSVGEGPAFTTLFTGFLDQADTLHLMTLHSTHYPAAHWQRRADGQWLPLERLTILSDPYFLTAVAHDEDHGFYYALQTYDPITQIKATATVTTSAQSQLQQVVTILPALTQPTLSFFYQLTGGGPNGSTFALTVQEGMTTTTVFSATTASNWQLGWADLTPWQGKTVTVTFQTAQAVGDSYLQVALDRVTLGSWRTPVPQQVTPHQLPWGIASSLTITGSNFIATPKVYLGERLLPSIVWQDDHTLTVNTPADLPPGRHDLWVVNPTGERMLLASGLVVGQQFYLPLVQR